MPSIEALLTEYEDGLLTQRELLGAIRESAEPPMVASLVPRVPAHLRPEFAAGAASPGHLVEGCYIGWQPPAQVRWRHRVSERVLYEWARGCWTAWAHTARPGREDPPTTLLVFLRNPAAEVRAAALAALAWRAEGYASADVVECVHDSDPLVRGWAAWALAAVGDRTAILPLLRAEPPERRPDLACLLVGDDDVGRLLVPVLSTSARVDALWVLGRLGAAAEPALDAVLAALTPGPELGAGLAVIERLGPVAVRALPTLEALIPAVIASRDGGDVSSLAKAVAALGQPAVPALLLLFADPKAREATAEALAGLADDERVAQALLDAVRTTPTSEVLRAAGGLGTRVGPALPALLEGLQSYDFGRTWGAEAALNRLGPHAAPLAPAIAAMLWDAAVVADDPASRAPERTRWVGLLHALLALGSAAEVACVAAFGDSRPAVRRRAVDALWHVPVVQPTTAASVLALANDGALRATALEVLGRHPAPGAVEVLVLALSDGNKNIRMVAAKALARAPDETALDALVERLGDVDPATRYCALSAIGALGCAASSAAPAVVDLLLDEQAAVVMRGEALLAARAAWTLGCLGPADAEAHGALVAAGEDSREEVRCEARKALDRWASGAAPTPDEVAPWRDRELRMRPFRYNV